MARPSSRKARRAQKGSGGSLRRSRRPSCCVLEDGVQQRLVGERGALDQLLEAERVAEQAAQAERVGGGPAAAGDEGREGLQRGSQVVAAGILEKLRAGDVAVERIVLAHRGDQRAGEIHAHLPHHAPAADERLRRQHQLARLEVELPLARRARRLVEGVHPAGQVVEVLAVAVPFEALVERLAFAALGQLLADAQAAAGRVLFALRVREAAQPAGARVVGAVAAEHVVHPVDQPQRQVPLSEREEVADGERVRPEVAALRARGSDAGALEEIAHQAAGELGRGHAGMCRRRAFGARPPASFAGWDVRVRHP